MIVKTFKKYKNARKKSMEIHEIRRLHFILDYTTKKMLNEKKKQKVDYFISSVNEMKDSLQNKSELSFLPSEYRNEIQKLEVKNLYDVEKMSNLLKQAFIEVRSDEKTNVFLTPIDVYMGSRGVPIIEIILVGSLVGSIGAIAIFSYSYIA